MTAPQDQSPDPLPIEPPHVVTRQHYERLAQEAAEQQQN